MPILAFPLAPSQADWALGGGMYIFENSTGSLQPCMAPGSGYAFWLPGQAQHLGLSSAAPCVLRPWFTRHPGLLLSGQWEGIHPHNGYLGKVQGFHLPP